MCYSGPTGPSGVAGKFDMKYRYYCKECGTHFNRSKPPFEGSQLVSILRLLCPNCSSSYIDLTEYGKLLNDRMKKIKNLNDISDESR